MTLLCVIPGPSHVYATGPDDRPNRWCFLCRKRVPHYWELVGDPPGVETYYDRQWIIRCMRCLEDHTWFPGCGPL